MAEQKVIVTTTSELLEAVKHRGIRIIVVRGCLAEVPSIRLAPGVTLCADGDSACIIFSAGEDGVQLTSDNTILRLRLEASPDRRVIFNDTAQETLGCLSLAGITAVGQVQILARDEVVSGYVKVAGLDIVAADTRSRPDRPCEYGVAVEQGAFTLWNMQSDKDVEIKAELSGLAAGRPGAPVFGSGIFVSGSGAHGGRLAISLLETDGVYTDGRIRPGTQNLITGGVFILHEAYVDVVRNRSPVSTYGVNDMVLDNWGHVDRWFAEGKLTSRGPSAMGVVNFGKLFELKINALIETFGTGARGYNSLRGTVDLAEFDRIVTHGDAAMGILIQGPIGRLVVRRGIETYGGIGETLVEGEIVELPAIGLSVRANGRAREIEVHNGIRTNVACIDPIEVQGAIEVLRVSGGLRVAEERI